MNLHGLLILQFTLPQRKHGTLRTPKKLENFYCTLGITYAQIVRLLKRSQTKRQQINLICTSGVESEQKHKPITSSSGDKNAIYIVAYNRHYQALTVFSDPSTTAHASRS